MSLLERLNYVRASIGVLLLMCCASLAAQSVEYSATQKAAFVEVYMESKATIGQRASDNNLKSLMDAQEITPDRFREIFVQYTSGDQTELTSSEISFLDAVQAEKERWMLQKVDQTKRLCIEHSISFEIYTDIKDRYRTDIVFQRSLAEYFQKYMRR